MREAVATPRARRARGVVVPNGALCVAAAALIACAPPQVPARIALEPAPGDADIAARCTSGQAGGGVASGSRIRAGRHVLTLVATDTPGARVSASAPMVLRPTSASDRSPRGGLRPDALDNPAKDYLYGATTLDFERVGAPVAMEPGDTLTPHPASLDPIRPGVLVSMGDAETVLRIGALGNRRDDPGWLDGAGIALRVRSLSGDTVVGEWSEHGIVRGRSGIFCAVAT